eukprot:jgi/Mesvir1/21708/Mv26565-RA.2
MCSPDAGKGIVESFKDFMQSIFGPGKSEASPEAPVNEVPAPTYRQSVLVAGATGGVGRHIVRYLLQDNCRVVALARDPEAAEKMFLEQMGLCIGPNAIGGKLEIRQGDVRQPDTLAAALQGCDAVVCAVGCRFRSPPAPGGDGPMFEANSSPEVVDFRGVAALARAAYATLPSEPRRPRDAMLFDFATCGAAAATPTSSSSSTPPASSSSPASPPTDLSWMRSNASQGSQGPLASNGADAGREGNPGSSSQGGPGSSTGSSSAGTGNGGGSDRGGGGSGVYVDGWERRDDGVMGGLSESVLRADDGCAVFEGFVRVDGGGFCSVRSVESQAGALSSALKGHDGILLRVCGDGQRYKVTLITSPPPVDAAGPGEDASLFSPASEESHPPASSLPPRALVETAQLQEPPPDIVQEMMSEPWLSPTDAGREEDGQPSTPRETTSGQEETGAWASATASTSAYTSLSSVQAPGGVSASPEAVPGVAQGERGPRRDLRYQASFDTVAGRWVDVHIPFDRFRAVVRSTLQKDAPPLDLAAVKQMGLTLSRVEYNREDNPLFHGGPFKLQMRHISAYSLPRPQFVLLSSAGVERSAACGSEEERKTHIPIVQLNPGSILRWKLAGEDAVRASGLPYAIVRACGLTREEEGTAFRLQVAQGDSISGNLSRPEAAAVCAQCLQTAEVTDTTFEVRRDELSRGFAQESYLQLFRPLRRDNVPNLPVIPNPPPPRPRLSLLNMEKEETAPLILPDTTPAGNLEPVTSEPK